MKTVTQWTGGMNFTSNYENHTISLSGETDESGKRIAFSPKSLLLSGLSGCSGIDIVEILTKMKVPFTKLEIVTDAEQVDEHPRVFEDINIEFRVDAPAEFEEKVLRAIQLSLEKYCGVAAMLGKGRKIVSSLTLL